MYKLDLAVDRKEKAAIERRRHLEEQRKTRIFNEKERQYGIDFKALDQQIKEKNEREELERRRNEALTADAVRNDKIALLLQRRQEADERELHRQLLEFRELHQQAHSRREWDLNDPEALKKQFPARVNDDDPRCGVSGLQKFDGEDLSAKAREEFQKSQLQEWCSQQAYEKRKAEEAEKEANRLYDLKRRELDERALELAKAEEQCRQAVDEAVRNYNKALALEQSERARLKDQQSADDSATHVLNALNSDLLTENPAQGMSALGPNRILPYGFKGLSPAQLEEIKKIQEQQIAEKEAERQAAEREAKEWERQKMLEARAAMLMQREVEKKEAEVQRQTAEENLRLAEEQKRMREYIEKEVYTNYPTSAFFDQFNTTSR